MLAAVYDAREETSPILVGVVTTDRGDVVSLADEASATLAAYRYDAYGNPTSSATTGPRAARIATRQILRYAGYAFDEPTALYYCSARYYDPATFSFITSPTFAPTASQSVLVHKDKRGYSCHCR